MRRFTLTVTALLALVVAAATPAADAQVDLSRWDQPVVAQTLLRVPGEGAAKGDTLYLPLHQRIVIEAEAVDQHGRPFPQENFRFGFDLDSSCQGLVSLESFSHGTISLQTGKRAGTCEVLFWVPNNMNLDHHLQIQVGGTAPRDEPQHISGGIDTREELVAASIFRAVLDREPDPSWLAAAADEVRRHNTGDVVRSLLSGPEFGDLRRRRSADQLLADFYRGLLGREPDPAGAKTYGDDLRRGRYEAVINDILSSDEFRRRVTRLPG